LTETLRKSSDAINLPPAASNLTYNYSHTQTE
jgi:hypothetical protein